MAEDAIWPALTTAGARALWIMLPILGATFFAALAAPIAIGGWNFSAGAGAAVLAPQSRHGLGRMFSTRGMVELGKGIAKVGVVGVIGWVLLKGLTPQLMGSRPSR
jgi:flagellar biosynthetic protein FlhB